MCLQILIFEGQLGDVVYVECPEVDSEVEKGNCAGAVESVKVSIYKEYCSGKLYAKGM